MSAAWAAVWLLALAGDARAFAPTLSGEAAWGDGGVCRRLRADRSEMADVRFTAPASKILTGVYLRIAGPRGVGAGDAFVLRVESDAGGLPSGQALAAKQLVPGSASWTYVSLGAVALGSEAYHLTIAAAPGADPRGRICYLKHAGDAPESNHPWSVALREEGSLAPLREKVALEPVFVLAFSDGTLWGQPYHDVASEMLSPKQSLSWTFTPPSDAVVGTVVARLDERNGRAQPRYRITDASGAELASGLFRKVGRVGSWTPAFEAEGAPVALRAGASYGLTLDVPAGGRDGKYVHRGPVSDFPGGMPRSARKTKGSVARFAVPSIRMLGGAAPAQPNLAPNPSFESDPMLDYFTHADVPSDTTFQRGSDASRSGARSVKIVSRQPSGKQSRWLSRNERIRATPGATYSASFWLKTAEVANAATVALNFWDGSAWTHLGTRSSVTQLRGTSGWTRLEVSGTAPSGAAYVRVEARLDGPGTLWADDVVLVRSDGDPPAPAPKPTAQPKPTAKPKPTPKPTAKPKPTPKPTVAPTPRPAPTARPTAAPTAQPAPTPGAGACSGRFHVAPHGSDANAGSAASPFRTIQRAADAAAAGDTVCVAAGLYRERVRVTRSGTAGKPIVFQAAPGTVVDGGDLHSDGWTNATELGRNAAGKYPVWKKKITTGGTTPYHGTLDGKYILRLRDTGYSGDAFMSSCAQSPATCTGGDRLRNGPRGYNTANASGTVYQGWSSPGTVEAMFGVDDGWTYVAFKDGGSANGRDLTFAPRGSGAFQIEASWVTVRGFTLRGANYPVYLPTSSAHHVTIEDNVIRNGFFGVFLAGGAHHNVVRRNDISIDYAHSLSPAHAWHWFTWNAFRNNSELHRASISMSGGGAGNEIAHNQIHDAFGGIDEDGSTPAGDGVRVHHNTIRTCLNDALTITGGDDSQWFDNEMIDVNIGVRFWPYGDGSTISYYRNRVAQPDSSLVEACMFFFRGSSSDTLRVYHNTCSGPLGLLFGSTNVSPGLPKLKLYNNLFSVKSMVAMNDWSGWSASLGSSSKKPDASHNWMSTSVPSWMNGGNVTGSARLWLGSALPSWLLDGAGTSAKGMGYDVSRSNASLGMPWAGFQPGYFDGGAPDAGAVQVD